MTLRVVAKKKFAGFNLDIDFVTANQLSVLFGPSGAGKSLTLQLIAGLLTADEGEIVLGGAKLFCTTTKINLPPQDRFIGYIFQNHALFPHLTVEENIAYGACGYKRRERYRMAQELLVKFNIGELAHKYPGAISGGQQQKVALARAIIRRPRALLLDEPFSALDRPTREMMHTHLKALQQELNIPTILVTHDLFEARALADRVLTITAGKVTHNGAPAFMEPLYS